MEDTAQLKAGVAVSYLSIAVNIVIQLVYTPLMLRLLGQSEYGLYNLAGSVISWLGLLGFGLNGSYTRFYMRNKAENDEKGIAGLNAVFLIVFGSIAAITLAAGCVLAKYSALLFGNKLTAAEMHRAKLLLVILVINLAVTFAGTVFDSYIVANENYLFQRLLNLLRIIIGPFITLPFLIAGYKSVAVVTVTTLVTVGVVSANIFYCFRRLHISFSFAHIRLTVLKEIFAFSFFIFINLIVDQINWNAAKFLLGRFRGTAAVAIYGLAAQINTLYMSFSNTVSSVFAPRVNRVVAAGGSDTLLTGLFIKIGRIQGIILFYLFLQFIFFGKYFILLWGGPEYQKSYLIAVLLLGVETIPLMQNLGIEIQRAKNMHRFRSAVYLMIAALTFLVSIPAISLFGETGAALGTVISMFTGNTLVMNWYYGARVGIDIPLFWKETGKLMKGLILPAAVGGLYAGIVGINSFTEFFLGIVLLTAAYACSMWAVGLNEYEKNLIRTIFTKMFCKRKGGK